MRRFKPFFDYPLTNDAVFSPDGTRLVTVAERQPGMLLVVPVVVWDILTGDELYVLNGLPGYVNSVSFSPDGSMFVTGITRSCSHLKEPPCADEHDARVFSDIILWDAETGTYLNAVRGLPDTVFDVNWSPGGDVIATRSYDAITFWSVPTILSTTPPLLPTPLPTATPALRPDGKVEVEIYFIDQETHDLDDFVSIKRIVEPTSSLPETVLREYFKGSNQEDKTMVPHATEYDSFVQLRIEDGIAYVHLITDEPCMDRLYLLTEIGKNLYQFPEIHDVRFFVNSPSGDGVVDIAHVNCDHD